MHSSKTIIDLDPWLAPYRDTIVSRGAYIASKTNEILDGQQLEDFALGYLHFGLHTENDGWVFREWAPNAQRIVLLCETNNWSEDSAYELQRLTHGEWEIHLPATALHHSEHYKLRVYWSGGDGFRLPSYTTYAVQDELTKEFDAVVWAPKTAYNWKYTNPTEIVEPPLIYEAHVGMSSEEPEVASYHSFTTDVLPRIKAAGYNTVQLMAIQEHPYYGSFGYHVANFFAASSRFGTPDDLKELVDTAHSLGLRVILDLVHSHAAKNEVEGLSRFDGSLTQYFHTGERGQHSAWDSRVFDYGKSNVAHFLLSNCRFWLDTYHIDGFRFDGVTSMLYTHHGLKKDFTSYDDYYGDDVDLDALTYLTLANQLIHQLRPDALTIAEEMSGFPGLAGQLSYSGQGFDYRLSMGIPDLWIKLLKEKKDEDWDLGTLIHELTTHRPEEKVISYAESHDQALVGDQTLLFRLIGEALYDHMHIDDSDIRVERGIALHKMIRLITASTHGGGYLNFMGNEFGHPEWIDFPREGNDWSFQYARRQWHLVDDTTLKYAWLAAFDRDMLAIIRELPHSAKVEYIHHDAEKRILSFYRHNYIFVYNFSPGDSQADYELPVPAGSYQVVLTSDDTLYGGQGRIDHATTYLSDSTKKTDTIKVYVPARTALALMKRD